MKRLLVVGVMLFVGFSAFGQDIPKIGLILATGGLGDRGFNDCCYWGALRAAQEIAEQYGVAAEDVLYYVEPYSFAEYEGYLRDFARAGEFAVIVGVGFANIAPLEEVGPEYPDQKFVVVDAVAEVDNASSIIYHDWEGAFLCGVVAGMLTKTGKVAFVGGMEVPLQRRRAQGFTQGAMWANPNITKDDVLVRWVGDFNNATLGREVALSVYQAGVDYIYSPSGKSVLGVFAAAEENPNWWAIGEDVDQAWSCPEHADVIVASGLKLYDVSVYNEIMKVVKGTWSPGVIEYGMTTPVGIGTGIYFGPWDVNEYICASQSTVALPNNVVHEILLKLVEAVNGIQDGSIVIEHE